MRRLDNGNLLVPLPAVAKGVIGDGMAEIGPDDDRFEEYDAILKEREARGNL